MAVDVQDFLPMNRDLTPHVRPDTETKEDARPKKQLTTTLPVEAKIRLEALSTMLRRPQGDIIAEALGVYQEQLSDEQRATLDVFVKALITATEPSSSAA